MHNIVSTNNTNLFKRCSTVVEVVKETQGQEGHYGIDPKQGSRCEIFDGEPWRECGIRLGQMNGGSARGLLAS
jgi:hypothetical protein